MARCEDFPCCGHESGCCPDYDEGGQQLNMKCVCGATLPLNNRFSICDSCMHADDFEDERDGIEIYDEYDDEQDYLLERQEMEDFEGLNGPFEDREYDFGNDW